MVFLKDKSKIKIRVFMEVMGWPAEQLVDHLKNIIQSLREKMKWKITHENYAEPIPLDMDNSDENKVLTKKEKEQINSDAAEPNQKKSKMFNTHVEFEAEFNDILQLFSFAMAHGPSVIEVLEPAEMYVTAGELQDILADMVSKAQTMDKEIKILAAQNKKMADILNILENKGILRKEPRKG